MNSYLQTSKMADLRNNYIICSILLLLFRFISMRSRLTTSPFPAWCVLWKFKMQLFWICCWYSAKADCHQNRLQVWVWNKHWFEEIIRKILLRFWNWVGGRRESETPAPGTFYSRFPPPSEGFPPLCSIYIVKRYAILQKFSLFSWFPPIWHLTLRSWRCARDGWNANPKVDKV